MVEKKHLEEDKDEDEEGEEEDDLFGALEGVVGPSLPWVISNGPI